MTPIRRRAYTYHALSLAFSAADNAVTGCWLPGVSQLNLEKLYSQVVHAKTKLSSIALKAMGLADSVEKMDRGNDQLDAKIRCVVFNSARCALLGSARDVWQALEMQAADSPSDPTEKRHRA